MEKRVLVCLNKEDWYDARDRERLLGQIREQVKPFVDGSDVVAVRAQTSLRPRIRVLPDGSQSEESVEVSPDIAPLASRMLDIVRRDGRDLLLANLLLQSRGLIEEARRRVQESLDRRAWETVDAYMWGAGGAAALSPLPVVDLVAGSAITAKMVVELARIYRQDIDLNTAVTLLAQLGKNFLAILGVTAAGPGDRRDQCLAAQDGSGHRHDRRRIPAGSRPGARDSLDRCRVHRVFQERDAAARRRLGLRWPGANGSE